MQVQVFARQSEWRRTLNSPPGFTTNIQLGQTDNVGETVDITQIHWIFISALYNNSKDKASLSGDAVKTGIADQNPLCPSGKPACISLIANPTCTKIGINLDYVLHQPDSIHFLLSLTLSIHNINAVTHVALNVTVFWHWHILHSTFSFVIFF